LTGCMDRKIKAEKDNKGYFHGPGRFGIGSPKLMIDIEQFYKLSVITFLPSLNRISGFTKHFRE
jgi:hypothetical protein